MEIVRSVNRSWIYDSYFSLYRPIHPGGNVRGENVRGHCPNTVIRPSCVWLSDVSWLSPRLLYVRDSQSNLYLANERARSASWCCSSGISTWLSRHCSLSSFNKNGYWSKAMLIEPRTSAVCRCIWSHSQFHGPCPTSQCTRSWCFTVRFRHSALNSSRGNLLT